MSESVSTETSAPAGAPAGAPMSKRDARRQVRRVMRSEAQPGTVRLLVLAAGPDDYAGVDLDTGVLRRIRLSAPDGSLFAGLSASAFDVIEARPAVDPEQDDLAQPEAITVEAEPVVIGAFRGRKARRAIDKIVSPGGGDLLGFPGNSAPYWEFRGMQPSLALVAPTAGPVLFRRRGDGAVWARFGWSRSDNWLPVEDSHACRILDASRRSRLAGNALAEALGFRPRYLVAAVSRSRGGYCYKTVSALLPRP